MDVSIDASAQDSGPQPQDLGSLDQGAADLGGRDVGSVDDLGATDVGDELDGGLDLGADLGGDLGVDLGPQPDLGFPDSGVHPSTGMNFFVSSEGPPGGDFGGLMGADALCALLAARVGQGGLTWRAYLSTSQIPGVSGGVVHARDRIGSGPWYNFFGDRVGQDVASIHSAGIDGARIVTELGTVVPAAEHDIITGSQASGEAWDAFPGNPKAPAPTCLNWSSNAPDAYTYVGHSDWNLPGSSGNWNATHEATCDPASSVGRGRVYCFATDPGVHPDAGVPDAGQVDLGPVDLGADAGIADLGNADLGPPDMGLDAGPDLGFDLGPGDGGSDAGPADLGPPDLGPPDMGPVDLGFDAGPADAGNADLGADAGPADLGEDAGQDLGPLDTGFDAGPPDLGPVDTGINPSPQMSFFVTSAGSGPAGGNLGGLAGADARCQSFAAAVGAGARTWRAYLSVHSSAGGGATINARDRIGAGPWFNFNGTMVAADVNALHASGVSSTVMVTERGALVPVNEHDILTGSQADGTPWPTFPGNPGAPSPTCFNWTDGSNNGFVYVGHADWDDPNTIGNPSWNASHATSCSEAGLLSTAGSGRFYCFAL